MATWKEDTIQALKNLGGVAHLSKIHKEVKKLRKGKLNPTWTQTIQRELETYSSDSDVWNSKLGGKEDLFYMAEGKGKGVWGLREMFAIAPTDLNWFQQLRTEGVHGDVINFWTPTPWNISGFK